MRLNNSLNMLFLQYKIENIDLIPHDDAYPIWQKEDTVGRKYWGIGAFWGLDSNPIEATQDLSQLEWDGNELYLDAQTDDEVMAILTKMVGILKYWKTFLESNYCETPFYLFASYDNGDMQIVEDDELPTRSVVLRFWADRKTDTVIDFDSFDDWDQPSIVEYCNFVPLT